MSESKTVSSGGIGFSGLLAIVFITLKLCGVIAWSWWWVLSPLWIPLLLVLGILLKLCGVIAWSWWWVLSPLWIPLLLVLGILCVYIIVSWLNLCRCRGL